MIPASIAGKRSLASGAVAAQRLASRGVKIVSASPVNDGKQVDIEFVDRTSYRFHTAWIKDAHPNLTGSDYYRKSAKTVFEVDDFAVDSVKPLEGGDKIQVSFTNCNPENAVTEEYVSSFLHAFAPYVGRPLHKEAEQAKCLPGTGSLLDNLYQNRKGWYSDLEMPTFDGEEMAKNEDMQIEFLERMMDPGVALIKNIGVPEGFDHVKAGIPMEELVEDEKFKCNFDWPEHSVIVMNNHRVLHGRATVAAGVERTMVFGYVMKTIYENRHRLLKQRQAERNNPVLNDKWLTRLPNQVLTKMV